MNKILKEIGCHTDDVGRRPLSMDITKLSIAQRSDDKKKLCQSPVDVKSARKQCKATFEFWKKNGFPTTGYLHSEYRTKRREYRQSLRTFLNQIESEKIKRLCVVSETDEKLFWKLINGQ